MGISGLNLAASSMKAHSSAQSLKLPVGQSLQGFLGNGRKKVDVQTNKELTVPKITLEQKTDHWASSSKVQLCWAGCYFG